MAIITEGGSETILHFDRFEDGCQDLLGLLLVYQ